MAKDRQTKRVPVGPAWSRRLPTMQSRVKREDYLYEQICAEDNLRRAHQSASRGKRGRKEVAVFEAALAENLAQLRRELRGHTYAPGEYSVFVKREPKLREIYKAPYRDRVVQWAIVQVMEPLWQRQFTADTYACIKGRGVHPLLRRLRRDLRKDADGTRYCFKMDIEKFYPSISHDILKQVLRRKIKDGELLWLLDSIIDSAPGVPIGNYLSQFFANLYLSELDHLLKEFVHVRYYYRYADDIVVLASDKRYLQGVMVFINDYLETERRLHMKGNYQIFPVESRGIDFVGYVTRHDYCLLRKRNKKALCRKVARMRKRGYTAREMRRRLASRLGWLSHCNSKNLLAKIGMKDWNDVKKKGTGLTGGKYGIEQILDKEIHLQAVRVAPSRHNEGSCLTLQYEVFEQLRGENGELLVDAAGAPRCGWVQHITFTGSSNIQKELDGVDMSEPIRCRIVKQPCERGRCFYTIKSVTL